MDIKNKGNDLEKAAITIMPEIGDILSFLRANNNSLFAMMSGSGSSCFAVFNNINDALEVSKLAQQKYPHYYVRQVVVGGEVKDSW